MLTDIEHVTALWRVYDRAVIADRIASAAATAASKTWHAPKSRRRASRRKPR